MTKTKATRPKPLLNTSKLLVKLKTPEKMSRLLKPKLKVKRNLQKAIWLYNKRSMLTTLNVLLITLPNSQPNKNSVTHGQPNMQMIPNLELQKSESSKK